MGNQSRIRIQRQHLIRMLDGQTVQIPTGVGLLNASAKEDEPWEPMERIQIPFAMLEAHARLNTEPPDELWTNWVYEAMVKHHPQDDGDPVTHLSLKRMDRAPIRNWRHFQQIKNEVCGPEREGIELFPAESRLADNANQYHMWVLPLGQQMPLGFRSGMVLLEDDDVDAFNTNGDPGRQEPLQPGLTIGDTMRSSEGYTDALGHDIARSIIEGKVRL